MRCGGRDDISQPYRIICAGATSWRLFLRMPADAVSAQGHRSKPLPNNQQTMLTILQEAGKDGLLLSEWNEKAKARG